MVVMLGCVGLTGGYFWLKNERANRPDRIWVPIPLNTELSHEQHLEFAEKLRDHLSGEEVLAKISIAVGHAQTGPFETEDAAIADLRVRLMCEVGEHHYAPSLNVGFRGKRRENAMLKELTTKLMDELQVVLSESGQRANP